MTDLRLIVQQELIHIQGSSEIFLHRGARTNSGLQLRSEEVNRIAPRRLRLIHRYIRLLQDFVLAPWPVNTAIPMLELQTQLRPSSK